MHLRKLNKQVHQWGRKNTLICSVAHQLSTGLSVVLTRANSNKDRRVGPDVPWECCCSVSTCAASRSHPIQSRSTQSSAIRLALQTQDRVVSSAVAVITEQTSCDAVHTQRTHGEPHTDTHVQQVLPVQRPESQLGQPSLCSGQHITNMHQRIDGDTSHSPQ